MGLFDLFDFPDRENEETYFGMDDIEHVYLVRDGNGWEMSLELEDGRMIDVDYSWSDEDAQAEIWDDLYWEFIEYGIDIDVETDY